MKNSDPSQIITILLVILCILAAIDLWRQYAINNDNYWLKSYIKAVKSSNSEYNFWRFGYRLEDLEVKLLEQSNYWILIKKHIDKLHKIYIKNSNKLIRSLDENEFINDFDNTRNSRVIVHGLTSNDSSIYQIRCQTNNGPLIRVGQNDFRTDERDSCQLFGSNAANDKETGPHTMFEKILLGNGEFALRSLGSKLLVSVIPPPSDHSSLPWKLVIGGPSIGTAERFRLTEEGYIYSTALDGLLQCSGDQMVKGYSSTYGTYNKFIFEKVNNSDVFEAQKLVHLSDQIISIQQQYLLEHQKSLQARKSAFNVVNSLDNPNPIKICIAVPMTSKGTVMKDVTESPFWTNLFDTFMKSIDWHSNRYIFRFYLGFDRGDSLYDIGDAWQSIREEFKHRATYRMVEQMLDETSINNILDKQLSIKLLDFDHLQGAPTQVVSQLVLSAYVDNFDYFYQVNDDTMIVTPNWVPKFVEKLASNPSIPNFGVTGPTDTNNEKILTHSFVHRTHIEVFGHLFPPYFKNWWSDDWITTVYGSEHTFLCPEIQIKHNVEAQKEHGYTRYDVDKGAQLKLEEELMRGHVQIDEWLKRNSLPRLPLPNICGYIPLTRYLASSVVAKKHLSKPADILITS